MGLNRNEGPIGGMLRTTYYPTDEAQRIAAKKLAPTADYPDDVYRNNIQISELNSQIEKVDGSKETKDKSLVIQVLPGWKNGTKITFTKEGDEQPNVTPGKYPIHF